MKDNTMKNFENSRDIFEDLNVEVATLENIVAEYFDLSECLDYTETSTLEEAKEVASSRLLELEYISNYGSRSIHEDDINEYLTEMIQGNYPDINFEQSPFNCIDWDNAIEEYIHDYTVVEIDNTTFYVI